jgi:hypothetical protein
MSLVREWDSAEFDTSIEHESGSDSPWSHTPQIACLFVLLLITCLVEYSAINLFEPPMVYTTSYPTFCHVTIPESYVRRHVEGLYCKMPIQCLASSKLLNPHPLAARWVCIPLPFVRGEDTLAGWSGGGGSIVRKTPDTALYSIYVGTLCADSIQYCISYCTVLILHFSQSEGTNMSHAQFPQYVRRAQ